MSETFTCPSCGWPMGRITTDDLPTPSHSAPLAAPQGQDIAGLVARLRDYAEHTDNDLCHEAADALERMGRCPSCGWSAIAALERMAARVKMLRTVLKQAHDREDHYEARLTAAKAENERLEEEMVTVRAKCVRARSENERLRAALEKVPECVCDAHSIARAALTGRGE